jgi:hypothetical protein
MFFRLNVVDSDFRFAQGGNALFEGKVRGNPKPQVVWTRKGLQMKGKNKF